jgi:hypothetical protein
MTSTSIVANDEEAALVLKSDEQATLILKPGATHTVTVSSSTTSWSPMTLSSAKQMAALDKQVVTLDLGPRLQPHLRARMGLNLGFGIFLFFANWFFMSVRLSNRDHK